MNTFVRPILASAAAVCLLGAAGVRASARSVDQTAAPSIVGAWTLDKDLSDQPPSRDGSEGQEGRARRGGGYGRGGFGGGMRGGRRGGAAGMNPEDAQRMRDAMREEFTAPEQLTIVQADATILITSQDGRTLRLSPDGKKIKDDNTGIERKTKWDDGKLVSEIHGLGPGKITETYAVDPETHRLHVTIHGEGGRNGQERTLNRVYDAAAAGK